MTEPGGQLRADLVLEGGGVKGIGLVGALSVLEEAGYRFERVAGTSAGSIVGSLVAAGMTSAEMYDVMTSLDYLRFRDATLLTRIPVLGQLLSLFVHEGMYEGRYVESFVADRLREKGVTTWGDLRRDDPDSSLPADHRYKLVVHVSDVTESALLRLPWVYESTFGMAPDDQSVADAVRASSSIPFFFRPKKLKRPGGETSWLVDGGMLSNFPVDVFDRTDGQPSRWPTIGIKLSAEKSPGTGGRKVSGLISLAKALVGTLTGWYDRMHINDPDVIKRTIFVDTTGVRATDFGITKRQQDQLYENGRVAATTWLARQKAAAERAAAEQ
jgi:NTE family protein